MSSSFPAPQFYVVDSSVPVDDLQEEQINEDAARRWLYEKSWKAHISDEGVRQCVRDLCQTKKALLAEEAEVLRDIGPEDQMLAIDANPDVTPSERIYGKRPRIIADPYRYRIMRTKSNK